MGIRLYAIYQVALGQPARKLEELYHVSFKQITNWVHRFEKKKVLRAYLTNLSVAENPN